MPPYPEEPDYYSEPTQAGRYGGYNDSAPEPEPPTPWYRRPAALVAAGAVWGDTARRCRVRGGQTGDRFTGAGPRDNDDTHSLHHHDGDHHDYGAPSAPRRRRRWRRGAD